MKEKSAETTENFKMSKTDQFPYFPFVGDFVAEQEVIDGSSYWSGYYTTPTFVFLFLKNKMICFFSFLLPFLSPRETLL